MFESFYNQSFKIRGGEFGLSAFFCGFFQRLDFFESFNKFLRINHEFDFKMGALRRNAAMLRAPLLAANVTTGPESPPIDFCKPSVRYRVKGIEVGVIGLATIDTPRTTFPSHVEGLRFEAYLPAVRAQARALVADGAEVLIVLAHVPLADLRPVAEATADLPIRLFIGGHDHQRQLEVIERDPATEADDVVMINPGPYAQHYGAVALTFAGGELIAHAARIVPVVGPPVDPPREPTVAAIVDRASEAVRPLLEQVVGRLDTRAEPGTLDFSPLGHLVADAWLERFSHAEVAITNLGGLRQPLEAGSVRMRDIMGTLPFSNDLVLVRLTPAQLRESLQGSTMLVGGIRYYYHLEAGRRVITRLQTSQGQPLEENRRYTVITTDFLYAGGDGMPFRRMDPEPTRLGVSWREPLVEYFRRRPDRGVVPPSDPRALPD